MFSKLCLCGCGGTVTSKTGVFCRGHNRRYTGTVIWVELEKTCQCGCGQKFKTLDDERRYVTGHNSFVHCNLNRDSKRLHDYLFSDRNPFRTQAHKDKLSKLYKGRTLPKEVIKKMVLSRTGNPKVSLAAANRIINGCVSYGYSEKGKVFSKRFSTEFYYRSSYEKIVLGYFESFNPVVDVQVEKVRIPYSFNGGIKHYIPDYLVTFSNGNKCLIEVKPFKIIFWEKNLAKISAGIQFAVNNNVSFLMLHEGIIFNPNSVTTMFQLAMAGATAVILPDFYGGLRDSLNQLVTVGREQK